MNDPAGTGAHTENTRPERAGDPPAADPVDPAAPAGPSDPAGPSSGGTGAKAAAERAAGATRGKPAGDEPDEEQAPTLLEQMGGMSGLVYSSIPVVVFVLANTFFGLQAGIWSAVASAVAITVLRVVRKEPLQPAISGFFGIAVAAFIAYRTGSAKGFFLFGIWASLIYCGIFVASVLIRWPLAGVIWNVLNGTGTAWRKDKPSRFGYDVATLAMAAVFAARFVVQRWLYDEDYTGWLAFAKIAMGYPLYALGLLVVVWAVRRSDKRLKELEETSGPTDAEIEAELRAKYSGPPVREA